MRAKEESRGKSLWAPSLPSLQRTVLAAGLCAVLIAPDGLAQIDPVKRRVFQAGYSLPLHEDGPLAAYGFYYLNQPNFPRTNLTLRMAIVPVFLDSELGVRQAFGPNTDLAFTLAGGGFADSYNEIRQGDYIKQESFTGHAADAGLVVYHLFNPEDRMPLYGILRGGVHGSFYDDDADTADSFDLPENRPMGYARVGVRLGGREPYLTPPLAGELSLWHESRYRFNDGPYGFNGDREVEDYAGLFWGRALLAYTFDKSKQYMEISVIAGTSVNPDRFSAYRLGGSLPLMSEFPLTLPGYHLQEISAEQFALLNAQYVLPIDPGKHVAVAVFGSTAVVDYLDGLEQAGHSHSGVGGGFLFKSPNHAWQFELAYAYGIDALREDGRGAHTITFQLQYDLDAELRSGGQPFWDPLVSANTWRGLFNRFFGR